MAAILHLAGDHGTFEFQRLHGMGEEVYDALVLGVRDYCRKNRFHKVLIGLSGGIDSSLVACIAADAVGPEAVLGISMPSHFSSEGSWRDSESLAKNLGIEFRVTPIREIYDAFLSGEQKTAICDDICYEPNAPAGMEAGARFFDRVRYLAATAFWTTPEGMADLPYVGNVAQATWGPPPAEVLRHLGLE